MSMIQEIQDKAKQYFQRYPDLKALFYFDADGQAKEEVLAMNLEGIRIAALESNPFTLKYRLANEWKAERVLVYVQGEQPKDQAAYQQFPLLGEMIAGKVLELDNAADFMEKHRLSTGMRPLVAKYIKELQYKHVESVCMPLLMRRAFDESSLQRALVSAFVDFGHTEDWHLISGKILTIALDGDDKKWNTLTNKLEGVNLTQVVVARFEESTGLHLSAWSQDAMERAAETLRYNQITEGLDGIPQDPYIELKITDGQKRTALRQLLTVMEHHATLSKKFAAVLEQADERIHGEKLIAAYGIEAAFAEYTPTMMWRVLSDIVADAISQPAEVLKRLQKNTTLRLSLTTSGEAVMAFATQAATCLNAIQEHQGNYRLDRPEHYIEAYTQRGYIVDRAYRKAIYSRRTLDETAIPSGDAFLGAMDALVAAVNRAYEQHLVELNREWLACFADQSFDFQALNQPLQRNFYAEEIDPLEQKVAVIISDALRFEAGQELLAALHQDPKNTAHMRHMVANIPSRTSMGMAMLLPGVKTWDADKGVLANGIPTDSTKREQVLQSEFADSITVKASDVFAMKQDERRELFKHERVYVYHDRIDSVGDKRPTEHLTFEAVEDAVEDLRKLVGTLHATLSVSRVIVTADHGFLYNDRKLVDSDFERHPLENAPTEDKHNRWGVTQEPIDMGTTGYCIPWSAATGLDAPLYAVISSTVNRYRQSGSGHQFVHGGGSLQELIVPLIESSRKREEITQKVGVTLVSPANLRVVASRLKVHLLQADAVNQTYKSREVTVALHKDGDAALLVSNQETLQLNSTSENPTERMHVLEFTLTPEAANDSFVILKVFDVEDSLNHLEEVRITNGTLITPDF